MTLGGTKDERGGAHVVVVGGGISGLAAAWALVQADPRLRVTVFEGSPSVGGKLALAEVAGLTVDAGAESMLARRPEAVQLATEVGLGADLVSPMTTRAGVWSRGDAYDLPAGTLMGVPGAGSQVRGLLTEDEARLVDAEVTRQWPQVTHDVDVASFVAARVGHAVVDRLVEPLLGGVYAGHADRLSLQATVPALWQVAAAGKSVTAAAAEAALTARPAPGAEPEPVFAGIAGGIGRLPIATAAALRRAGASVQVGTTVRDLSRTVGGWRLTTGATIEEQVVEADAVVLAVPARAAARLLTEVDPVARQCLSGVELASMALVTAVLPNAQRWIGRERSGLLVPPIEGRLVKAVTYSSAKWGWVADSAGDDLVVRMSVGRQGEEAALQRSDRELTEVALAELADLAGLPLPRPVDSRVVRWGGGLPQYAVGHLDVMATARESVARQTGLALCGAYLDGLGIPACVATARAAAAKVLDDLATPGHGPGRTMGS